MPIDRNACQSKSHRWSQYDAGVRQCQDCGQIDAYRAMPIDELKPVAWRWRTIDGGWHIQEARPVKYGADIYGRGPLNEEPLYTHPTPIAADTGLVERLQAKLDVVGQEAFTLRNRLQMARDDAAKWLRLHDEQDDRAEAAEQREAVLTDACDEYAAELATCEQQLAAEREQIAELEQAFADSVRVTINTQVRLEGASASLSSAQETLARIRTDAETALHALNIPEHKLNDVTFLRGSIMTAKAFIDTALTLAREKNDGQ